MEQFYGTKTLNAKPMTRGEYNSIRGWELPANENGSDEGYLVEYIDGGKANVEGFAGYVSWSPKDVFEASYQPTNALSFGHAIEAVKKGLKVARAGWNGKGMFIFLVPGSTFQVNRAPLLGIYPEGTTISYHGHIDMKTVDNQIMPWGASHSDMLSDDWYIVCDTE